MSFDPNDTKRSLRIRLREAELECEGLEYAGNFAASTRNICFIISVLLVAISTITMVSALCISTRGDTSFWLFVVSITFFGASLLGFLVSFFSHRKLLNFEKTQRGVCDEILVLETEIYVYSSTLD